VVVVAKSDGVAYSADPTGSLPNLISEGPHGDLGDFIVKSALSLGANAELSESFFSINKIF